MQTYKDKIQKTLARHRWQIRATTVIVALNVTQVLIEFAFMNHTVKDPAHSIMSALSYTVMACVLTISLIQCIIKHETELYHQYDHACVMFLATAGVCMLYPMLFNRTENAVLLCTHVTSYSLTSAILTKALSWYMKEDSKSNKRR